MTRLSRWNFDRYVRRPGTARFEMPAVPQYGLGPLDKNLMSADPYWIVEATFGESGVTPSGSASFGHCLSYEEAVEQLADMRAWERNSEYTDWVIVEYTPTIIGRVVHREPVREKVVAE